MDFVNNKGEVFFGIIGSMPDKYQTSALLIDIGSGNTKIGYLEDNGRKTVSIEIPYGTVSFSEAAKKTNRSEKDYSITLSSMSARQLTPLLKQELTRKPAILERKPVFMTGGVVWAMATILYPEKKDAFLNLTVDDITKFYDMAVRKKSGIFNVDHTRIKNKEARGNAEKQLNSVKNVFTADDIIAGATLLKAISEDLRLKGRDIYFSRYGGWLFGYISVAGCNIEDKKEKTGI